MEPFSSPPNTSSSPSPEKAQVDAPRLSGLTVDDTAARTYLSSSKRTRLIRKLRLILPLLALVMTLIIITWEDGAKKIGAPAQRLANPAPQTVQNELLNPVFNSVDEQNQPYKVSADKALQNRTNPDLMDLVKPTAALTQKDGTVLEAWAQKGLYAQKAQKLNLFGDVVLKTSEGNTLKTQELRLDIVTRKSYSGQDVMLEGAIGTLSAKGLEGDANTGILTFTGPAKIILNTIERPERPKERTPE